MALKVRIMVTFGGMKWLLGHNVGSGLMVCSGSKLGADYMGVFLSKIH